MPPPPPNPLPPPPPAGLSWEKRQLAPKRQLPRAKLLHGGRVSAAALPIPWPIPPALLNAFPPPMKPPPLGTAAISWEKRQLTPKRQLPRAKLLHGGRVSAAPILPLPPPPAAGLNP